MQKLKFKISILYALFFICVACSEQINELPNHVKNQDKLEKLARQTFLNSNKHDQLSDFVKASESLINSDARIEHSAILSEPVNNIFQHRAKQNIETQNIASIERQDKLTTMFITQQLSMFANVNLSKKEMQFLDGKQNNSAQFRALIDSLNAIISRYPVLQAGDLNWYLVDDQLKMMAYQRSYNKSRAYVAFNFSFDTQDMPFPFGFMNSTKITLWQTDANTPETFVTQGSLSLRPLTAAIVIVD